MPKSLPYKSYARIDDVRALPTLIEVQLDSFRWFQGEGLRELFDEISPIQSFNKNLELRFLDFWFEEPKYGEKECRDRDMTFASPLWVRVRLINKETGEIQDQPVFMGDFPLMTENGTFVINGAERVVVSQLIRSPGVYFTTEEDRATGRQLCMAKLIPSRGRLAGVRDQQARRPVREGRPQAQDPGDGVAARAGCRSTTCPDPDVIRTGSDEELLEVFGRCSSRAARVRRSRTQPVDFIEATIERDPTKNAQERFAGVLQEAAPGRSVHPGQRQELLERAAVHPPALRPGQGRPPQAEPAAGSAGRPGHRTLTKMDLIKVVERIIRVNIGDRGGGRHRPSGQSPGEDGG